MAKKISNQIRVPSVTRDEINTFWRMKKMVEEEHLMAAQKAAARLRAKSLKEGDYMRFEQLLKEIMMDGSDQKEEQEKSGIKDWWTKSKYAYLNQPAIKSMCSNTQHGYTYTYVPQNICYTLCSQPSNKFYNTPTFGVY